MPTVISRLLLLFPTPSGMSILRSGYRRPYSSGAWVSPHLGSFTLREASCHVVSNPVERPTWSGTQDSCHLPPATGQAWKWICQLQTSLLMAVLKLHCGYTHPPKVLLRSRSRAVQPRAWNHPAGGARQRLPSARHPHSGVTQQPPLLPERLEKPLLTFHT